MDKVLKQRLVGATILIALAVIFVPMLFEEPATVDRVEDLSMDIPAPPPGRGEIRRLPLEPERVSPVQPDVPIEPPPASVRVEEPALDPEGVNQPTPSESRAGAEPEPEAPTEPMVPASEPEEIVLLDTPATEEPERQESPVPEASALQPLSGERAEAVLQGDWIVQVASFSSIETAEGIKVQLEQLGHRADSELLVRGDTRLHRVWAGPYPERAEAERARSQIAATIGDVDPIVRALSAGEGSLPGTTTGPVFSVQVGVFAEQANAKRQSDQLMNEGFDAFIYADETGSRPVWRVRVGRYAARDQAEVLLERLNAEASLEGLIVTHP